jgi:hypothetical protein
MDNASQDRKQREEWLSDSLSTRQESCRQTQETDGFLLPNDYLVSFKDWQQIADFLFAFWKPRILQKTNDIENPFKS